MEDATLLRKPLTEPRCHDFLRLAEHLQAASQVGRNPAPGQDHLGPETLEEYCFGRLAQMEKDAAGRHLAQCEDCRTALTTHREFIACLKFALKSCPSAAQTADIRPVSIAEPKFSPAAILAAREKLPISRLAGIESLRLFEKENVSLDQLDRALKGDPVVSAHLIRVANSALLSFGQEARTVSQAIGRIGLERTKLHVYGLAVKRMYSSPPLQKIWNHSILAAQVARQIAGMTPALSADEASLVALVHDIGQIVLANLGQPYERARSHRLAKGMHAIQIEEELCGANHATVGADLLLAWRFPSDMAEAVRHHHTPSDRVSPLSSLLYVAESWLENQEDICDLTRYQISTRRLGLTRADLRSLSVKQSPDLELLRFAA